MQVNIGEVLLALIDEAFSQYRLFRETADTNGYQVWAESFKLRVQQAVEQFLPLAGYEAGKILRSLRNQQQQWWYFLDHPQVPPDHNLAERALRLAVTKRKVSGGSRSMERFSQTATLLSVAQTCRFQGRERDAIFTRGPDGDGSLTVVFSFPDSCHTALNARDQFD